MSLKLKLNTRPSHDGAGTPGATPSSEYPPMATPASATSTGGPKLKLTVSQPPTPANEHAPLVVATTKPARKPRNSTGASKKRAAKDDISPAAKRTAKQPTLSRKISLKIPSTPLSGSNGTPLSATSSNKIKLGFGQRKLSAPKIRSLNVKRPPPPRTPGTGYDSEDSDAEEDPAIQQAFVLRMTPSDDATFLREAIAAGKVGVAASEGGTDVGLRFLDPENRRAIVTVRDHKYAAVLVDLPCIVETMKSWDRKGWWKVADVSQMLLVLGRCESEEAARNFDLPKEVDKKTLQFAHGLTPPMHWVRKRRFRKRPSYKDMANVDEEVARLMREDDEAVRTGGEVTTEVMNRAEANREISRVRSDEEDDVDDDDDDEMDAEGEAIETVENEDGFHDPDADAGDDEEDGAIDLEGGLQQMFDAQTALATSETPQPPNNAFDLPNANPLADQAASMAAVESAMVADFSVAGTPAGEATSPNEGEEEESDEDASDEDEDDDDDDDDDDDKDSPDAMDEDALARQAEKNQQREEVMDLQREIDRMDERVKKMNNQLIKEKMKGQLEGLREELRTKKAVFGFEADD